MTPGLFMSLGKDEAWDVLKIGQKSWFPGIHNVVYLAFLFVDVESHKLFSSWFDFKW